MTKKSFTLLIITAVFLKLVFFSFAAIQAPESKFRNDTKEYLESGVTLVSEGVFGAVDKDGTVAYQYYRTPGYPLFLGIFHGLFRIPLNGIIFIQILLTVFSAVIVYRIARRIDPRLASIALFIMLFDPSITVFSLMLLTESLFLFLITLFIYSGIVYLQERKKRYLLLWALALAAATYVRPISFYLGGVLALFVLYAGGAKDFKKSIAHACIFVFAAYSLLFLWQWRNYDHFREFKFSSIENSTVGSYGLYKSYARNKDSYTQGTSPFYYYVNVTSRCLASLFTRPASLKYFGSDTLKKLGKLFSYPWILFWLAGFALGLCRIGKNIPFQFLLLVIIYFSAATVLGAMWGADARFRVPMMPCIAVLSSYGWERWIKKRP